MPALNTKLSDVGGYAGGWAVVDFVLYSAKRTGCFCCSLDFILPACLWQLAALDIGKSDKKVQIETKTSTKIPRLQWVLHAANERVTALRRL